jgi:hypothetical protein
MSNWIAVLIAMAVGAVPGVGRSALESAGTDHHGRAHHIFMTGKARMTVDDALTGAIRRVSMPGCEQVFEDFTDQAGRALTLTLAATGATPADLMAGLYFVEGDDTIQCRADTVTAAFTTPGSRVIYVCGKRFAQFAANTKPGELLLIHEFLHTLGLGENPPSSSRITTAVMTRCG